MILGGGSNCQGCGCSEPPLAPVIRHAAGLRGFPSAAPFLILYDATYALPSYGWFDITDSYGNVSSYWVPGYVSAATEEAADELIDWTDWQKVGIFACFVGDMELFVKWSEGYFWAKVTGGTGGADPVVEVIYRKVVSSTVPGDYLTAGRVIFTTSDIHSCTRVSGASNDYTGVGEFGYMASTNAASPIVTGKHIAVEFSAPSVQSYTRTRPPSLPSGCSYGDAWDEISVEGLIGPTFEVDLTGTPTNLSHPRAASDGTGCYANESTTGYCRGVSVTVDSSGEFGADFNGSTYGGDGLALSATGSYLRAFIEGDCSVRRTVWRWNCSGNAYSEVLSGTLIGRRETYAVPYSVAFIVPTLFFELFGDGATVNTGTLGAWPQLGPADSWEQLGWDETWGEGSATLTIS
jgi:hypothetical protein